MGVKGMGSFNGGGVRRSCLVWDFIGRAGGQKDKKIISDSETPVDTGENRVETRDVSMHLSVFVFFLFSIRDFTDAAFFLYLTLHSRHNI